MVVDTTYIIYHMICFQQRIRAIQKNGHGELITFLHCLEIIQGVKNGEIDVQYIDIEDYVKQ